MTCSPTGHEQKVRHEFCAAGQIYENFYMSVGGTVPAFDYLKKKTRVEIISRIIEGKSISNFDY